ncbi:MAG: nuclear transport factor 2 family protein [Lachnotalea sp.]
MSINFQDQIRDRLQNGFKNWNGGYEGWLEWCNTLYEPDAHYNVQVGGSQRRLTLQEYKDLMEKFFENFDVKLGEFQNMLVVDDWCSIRYIVTSTNKATGESLNQKTMEFVNFKDNGGKIGARVIEGWALSDVTLG